MISQYAKSCIKILCLVPLVAVVSCSSVDQSVYQNNKPLFDVRAFFEGDLVAHGVVKNRSGKVTRYFSATIDASWDKNGVGTLDEVFLFNDGERQTRVWTLVPSGNGRFIASANDVVGDSVLQTSGNSLFLNYKLVLPRGDSTVTVDVDDRMYLVDEKTVINESVIRKFGIRFGEVVLTIIKSD